MILERGGHIFQGHQTKKKIHLGYILILLANESPKKKICKIKVMEARSQKKKRDEEESSFLG